MVALSSQEQTSAQQQPILATVGSHLWESSVYVHVKVTGSGQDKLQSAGLFVSQVNSLGCVAYYDLLGVLSVISKCRYLNDPENGRVSLTGTIESSVATYTCNEGFSLVGDSRRVCQDREWSGKAPVCSRKYIE